MRVCFDLTNTATSEFLTTETPLRIRIWDRRLARSPKNEPNSLIHTRHRGIPHRPYTMQKARPPFVLGAMLPKPDDYSKKKKKVQKDLRNSSSSFFFILFVLHNYSYYFMDIRLPVVCTFIFVAGACPSYLRAKAELRPGKVAN